MLRDRLHQQIVSLPVASQQRCAWVSAGRGSHMFIVSRATHDFECSPQEFREMMTTYLGSRSLAVAPYAARGLHVPCSKTAAPGRLVDAWGLELGLATIRQ